MKISVKVKPRSRFNRIESGSDGSLVIHVSAPAREGKANEAVISLLSEYFRVPKKCVRLVTGDTARSKVFEILKAL
jgi:hypothetical protein